MKNLFMMGGPLFMGILTLLFTLSVGLMLLSYTRFLVHNNAEKGKHGLNYGRAIGLGALIVGILGQLIGLYSAFSTIEKVGSVSQQVLVGGLKVSMITTLYGLLIYLITLGLWFAFNMSIDKKALTAN